MDKPNFYAVIPATVLWDKNLRAEEKILYAHLSALSNKEGYCWASNQYLADIFGVHRNTVSEWINNLKKNLHIDVQVEKNYERKIYIVKGVQQNDVGGFSKNAEGGSVKTPTYNNNLINKENTASDEASPSEGNFDTWLEQYTKTETYAGEDSGMVEGWLVPGRKRPATREEMAKRYKSHLRAQTPVSEANRGQLGDSSDRFFDIYASVLENRYGQRPLVGWSTKQLVKKNLLDKHPKQFVREYMQWVLDTDTVEKEWKYNLKALCSESNINKFLASK